MVQENSESRLIVVSNRLPVVLSRDEHGSWIVERGMGGLVTAISPVLRSRRGLWIGWPGTALEDGQDFMEVLQSSADQSGFGLVPVLLTHDEKEKFYYGFSNEVLWPLFHDLQSRTNFDPTYWRAYQRANVKFARVISQNSTSEDFVWIHDYHLMDVSSELRSLGVESKIGFFLHTPFPPLDIFVKLPWRSHLLRALLDYDLLGFQTLRDMRNFVNCVESLLPSIDVTGAEPLLTIRLGDAKVRVGTFPISIDYREFADMAASEDVTRKCRQLRVQLSQWKVVLGVDRLDYTKGIPHKLKAFRNALERFPELRQKIVLLQVLVPSREHIPEYNELKAEIEQLVGQINGEFSDSGWVPIHYMFRSMERTELLAYYRLAHTALVTPLKDGMNLVAKEFCAANVEENSTLILSEFAGSAAQFQDSALLVNPYDMEGTAEAIHQAYHMSEDERHARMRALRRAVRRQDIFWWVKAFMHSADAGAGEQFEVEDYVPHIEAG